MQTIAAISTANSPGGIGVIRISGEQALAVADSIFRSADGSRLQALPGYQAKFGHIWDKTEKIDQAVALVFRSPHSYTGEDVVELSCHGGLYLVTRVLEAALGAGAVPAGPGEFTKRAFLNGKMDLTSAESVMHLISANGAQAAAASLQQLEGNLYHKIKAVLESLLTCSANLAAWVDYPDEEIPDLDIDTLSALLHQNASTLRTLLERYDQGQAVLGGIDTVIAGHPNAGKSTLMNLLSGRQKSIVTDVPGTTRDVVEETVKLGNLTLRLSDTAGLRQSNDAVESIGIRRAYEKLSQAQLVFAVFDRSEPLQEEDRDLIRLCTDRPAVAVINKSDLPPVWEESEITSLFTHAVTISAQKEQGIAQLAQEAEALLGTAGFDPAAPLLAGERQRNCCRQSLCALEEAQAALQTGLTYDAVNVSIDAAIDALLSLTGEKATQAVVDQVFSTFCVGK